MLLMYSNLKSLIFEVKSDLLFLLFPSFMRVETKTDKPLKLWISRQYLKQTSSSWDFFVS